MRKILLLALVAFVWSAGEARAQYWITYTPDCSESAIATQATGPLMVTCIMSAKAFIAFLPPHENLFGILVQSAYTYPFVCPAGSPGGSWVGHSASTRRMTGQIALMGSSSMISFPNQARILKVLQSIDYNGNRTGGTITGFNPGGCYLPG
jgi:hypothetical protein